MPKAIQSDFKSIFENAPGLNLILSPDLTIIAASNPYLQATMTKRLDVIGHPLFEIFPDNPADRSATGVSNLSFSLNYVLEHRTSHKMSIQKYDIRRPDGTFEERYWQPLNTPVFNEQNELVYIIHNVEDVTQLENAEEQIRFLAAIAKNIHDPIIATDNNYIITDWNEAAELLLEWSKEEVLGKNSVEVLKGSYLNGSSEQIIASLKGKGYWKGEAIYHTKSGNPVNVLTTASQIIDGEGIVTGNLALFRDISDRKKIEIALTTLNNELEQRVKERTEDISKSEKRFRALVENNEGIISLIDDKLKMLFRSASATRITGWTNDEFEKTNAAQHIHPDDMQNMQLAMNKSLQSPGENIPLTIRVKHKNGHYIWLEGMINNVLHDPAIAGIITNMQDITERKKAEDALKSSNFSLSEAQRIAKLGDWTYYFNGDLKWSDNMNQLYGLPSKIATTNPAFFFELVHPDDQEKMQQWMQTCLAGQAAGEYEFRLIWPNGCIHYYNGTGELKYDKKNTPLYLHGTVQDITERKEAEQKLIKANRLYFFISQINQMIIRTTDEKILFKEACHIAVDLGKFRMAWVGMIDQETKKVVPLMHAGEERGYLSQVKNISVDDLPKGRGPSGSVLLQGQYIICNDIETDSIMAPWKEAALERGYLSSMALPIKKFGEVVGVFHLYAAEKNFFDAEEISLLSETTGDVAFALEILEKDKQRKKAEEKLTYAEKKFRALIQNSTDGLTVIAADGTVLEMSPSGQKILGYEPNEIIGKIRPDLIHEDDRSAFIDAFDNIIKDSTNVDLIEYRHKMPDETYKWLECSYQNLLNEPTINAIVLNYRDISKRKELEDLLHKSNALARLGSWEIDLLKGSVYWSDITREIHEAESSFVPDLATGINFYKEGPGRNLISQKVKEAIELGKPWDEELQIITCKNNERWIRTIGEAEFVDSKCVRVYGSFQDITERKKADVQIQESENRYRRLFDTSPIAITEEDHTPFYEKIESLRALGISKNYATYFHNHGEELYEMLGKVQIIGVNQGLLDLTGAKNLEDFVVNRSKCFVSMTEMTVFKLMDLIRDGGGYFEEETKIKSLSGDIKEVVVRLKYPAAPPYNSIAITMNDVTKQKEFEQKIIESENRMHLATSSAGMGVWYWDIKNDIMIWDKRLYQIYDIDESQLGSVNEGWLSRLHPEDKDMVNEIMQTAMAERKRQYSSEFRIIKGDGSVHYIKGTGITEYDDKGDVMRLMGIYWDVTETRLADEEIKNTAEQLRQLTAHLQTIREEERKRIAREIHDELGQQLTAIKMDLAWIDKKIQGGENFAKETNLIKNKLQNLISLVDGSNESVRKILHELRHGILEDNGLLEALEWQGNQFTEITGIPVKFITNETEIESSEKIASCIFRVYQETLTNIMRYAQASKVWATLSIEDESIIFVTEDNGKGFDINELQNSKSFGILGMKERVHSLNGVFILDSIKGRGTKIKVSLPYNTLKGI